MADKKRNFEEESSNTFDFGGEINIDERSTSPAAHVFISARYFERFWEILYTVVFILTNLVLYRWLSWLSTGMSRES